MTYRITTETFRLSMNNGGTHDFVDFDRALEWALEFHGVHAHYECEDERVLLYRDDEAMDADETGAEAMGVIERIAEEEEIEPDYDDYEYRRPYCSDRMCGATDCTVCYP